MNRQERRRLQEIKRHIDALLNVPTREVEDPIRDVEDPPVRDREGSSDEDRLRLLREEEMRRRAEEERRRRIIRRDRDEDPPVRDRGGDMDRDPPETDRGAREYGLLDNPTVVTGENMLSHQTEPFKFVNTHFKGNYRSALHTNMGNKDYWDLFIENCEFEAQDPNGPPTWDKMGMYWGSRMYGIRNITLLKSICEDLFGKAYAHTLGTSMEGHFKYLTLSPVPGSKYKFQDLLVRNSGGHGLALYTAIGGRAGNAKAPQFGGEVLIDHCTFKNTDIAPHRGSYCLALVNSFCKATISNSIITMDSPDYMKNGVPKRSRAAINVEGVSGDLLLENNTILCADPSDRTYQIAAEGPPVVTIQGNTIDCAVVSINDPYGDKEGTLKTHTFNIHGNEGSAQVYFNGQNLGRIDQLSGDYTL